MRLAAAIDVSSHFSGLTDAVGRGVTAAPQCGHCVTLALIDFEQEGQPIQAMNNSEKWRD